MRMNMLGEDPNFLSVLERVSLYAPLNRPVLVVGERGTGKELIANRLHYLSERWDKSYFSLNCASLNPNLIESELFGHQAGAFTGASQKRIGLFEQAHGSTLFLDELASLPFSAQEKLLRLIEYGEFQRLGSNTTRQVDVRLVCACNEDLPSLAEQGKFRADLLDRLSFAVVTLPPLRQRPGDIQLLAEHFANKMAKELGLAIKPQFSASCLQVLYGYAWPGNVRQLKNVVERAVVDGLNEQGLIEQIQIDPFASPWRLNQKLAAPETNDQPAPQTGEGFYAQVHQLEQALLLGALEQQHYQQTKTAEQLGLTYHQLRGLLKKHQINVKQSRNS